MWDYNGIQNKNALKALVKFACDEGLEWSHKHFQNFCQLTGQ